MALWGAGTVNNIWRAGGELKREAADRAMSIATGGGNRSEYDIRNPFDPQYNQSSVHTGTPNNYRPPGTAQPYSRPLNETISGDTSPVGSGAYGSGGSGGPSYSPEDLAYLDSQQGTLDRQMGRTDTTLRNTLDAILQNYNKELGGANTTRGRNIEDFNTKTQVSEQGRGRELGKVDTSARMLADSLRQKLGLASGSGSSAYQLTAPRAVQRQASEQRGDVLQDYSANFQALDTDKRRSEEDYNSLLGELNKQKTAREGGAYGDIEEQRNQIRDNMGRVAGQRAQLLGGGYQGVRSAMAPYESQIQGGESLIDSIYSKYAAKYNVNPLKVNNTNIRDYAVDRAAVRDNAATGNQNEYAPYKPYVDEEEERLV